MVDFKSIKLNILRRRCNNNSSGRELQEGSTECKCLCRKNVEYVGEECVEEDYLSIKRPHILLTGGLLLIVGFASAFYFFGISHPPPSSTENDALLVPPNPMTTLPSSPSVLRRFKRAAVCADSAVCARVGKDILEKNGSAADAAIATLFCNGVVTMQSMGIGGGFLLTIYKKDQQKAYFLNAREKAPLAARNDMYKNSPTTSKNGPLAVAVPGELRGYWALYQRFGTLPWRDLVQPSVDICNKGYIMTRHQYRSIFNNNGFNKSDENFREWFLDENNNFKKVGSRIRPKQLCKTLSIIASQGGNDLYNGTLSGMFLDDIKASGGIITWQDLQKYQAEWEDPISLKFDNHDVLYTAPPPGSGVILSLILNILHGYHFDRTNIDDLDSTILTYHRIVEAFKYAYAKRTELGDPKFVDMKNLVGQLSSRKFAEAIRKSIVDDSTFQDPQHYGAEYYHKGNHGTAHISIIDQNGDAVSVTSSVNLFFGNGQTSRQTGIVYNSVMDDFSFSHFDNYFGLPGSPNNEMVPGKRPLSSMTPTIIVDKDGDPKIVIGASGGTAITSSVAWALIRTLWFDENIKEAVDSPRLHHQLYPMEIKYEYGITQPILDGLKRLGHKVRRNVTSIICGLKMEWGEINANSDYRKGGDVFGLT